MKPKVVRIEVAWLPAIIELVLTEPGRMYFTRWEEKDQKAEFGAAEITVISKGRSVRRLYGEIVERMTTKEGEKSNGH